MTNLPFQRVWADPLNEILWPAFI